VFLKKRVNGILIEDSLASITWDVDFKGKETFFTNDPTNLLQNVKVKREIKGDLVFVTFEFEFTRALEKSTIMFLLWDAYRNSWRHYFVDAIEVIEIPVPVDTDGDGLTDGAEVNTHGTDPNKDPWDYVKRYETEGEYKKWFDRNYPEYTIYNAVGLPEPTKTKLPDWIKNNAKWWSSGAIEDRDFSKGIEYMVKEGIIRIPKIESEKEIASFSVGKIPDWIKNNAKWWSEGKISDDDFSKGIEYMVKEGIIKV